MVDARVNGTIHGSPMPVLERALDRGRVDLATNPSQKSTRHRIWLTAKSDLAAIRSADEGPGATGASSKAGRIPTMEYGDWPRDQGFGI